MAALFLIPYRHHYLDPDFRRGDDMAAPRPPIQPIRHFAAHLSFPRSASGSRFSGSATTLVTLLLLAT